MDRSHTQARAHRGPALLLVCALALTTGVALFGLARAVTAPVRSDAPAAPSETVPIVRSFYDAANTVLRTGDATALDAVLAPDFVDHHPTVGVTSGRDGLAQTLVARHATFSGLRLVVDHIAASGDQVTVRVHAEGETDSDFLGLPLPAEAGRWGPVDVFRVEGEAIVERWGSAPGPLLAQPLWVVPCPAVPGDATRVVVSLWRRSYGPGETGRLGVDAAAHLVVVETGTLTAVGESMVNGKGVPLPEVQTTGGPASEVSAPVALETGALVAIPPTARLSVRNDATTPAIVVVVTVAAADRLPAGTAALTRASAEVTLPPGATLAAGRLALSAGMGFAWTHPPGPILLLVEAGRLEAASRDDNDRAGVWHSAAAGEGWATRAGGGGVWQAAPGDPAVLFVLTIAGSGGAVRAGSAR